MGLREEKKRRTRKTISDIATRLFIDRGYHEVTIAEVAKHAEVSVPTVFNYFPTKESLVFDEEAENEELLISAVEQRKPGVSILQALYEIGVEHIESIPKEHRKDHAVFLEFVERTPELNAYAKQMWLRNEKVLADVIRKESGRKVSPFEAESIARFVLDAYHRVLGTTNPKTSLRALFNILESGWKEV